MSPRKTYILKLYVAGNTPNSMRALKTLRNILETEFQGVYALKVIDVLKNPQLAEEDKILATPTLSKILRRSPDYAPARDRALLDQSAEGHHPGIGRDFKNGPDQLAAVHRRHEPVGDQDLCGLLL